MINRTHLSHFQALPSLRTWNNACQKAQFLLYSIKSQTLSIRTAPAVSTSSLLMKPVLQSLTVQASEVSRNQLVLWAQPIILHLMDQIWSLGRLCSQKLRMTNLVSPILISFSLCCPRTSLLPEKLQVRSTCWDHQHSCLNKTIYHLEERACQPLNNNANATVRRLQLFQPYYLAKVVVSSNEKSINECALCYEEANAHKVSSYSLFSINFSAQGIVSLFQWQLSYIASYLKLVVD